VVLLIDEVDRADEALEAVLLEMLAEYQVSVPEIGTFVARQPPWVILTSNNTRDLSAALKRRCLHLFLGYPSAERELEILRSKKTGLPKAAAERLVRVVRGLRGLDLRKAPSISETVDWARTLAVLGVEEITPAVLADTVSVVVKYARDVPRALDALPALADPNAALADEPAHDHSHDHGHHDHQHHRDEDQAKTERAAKDQPGRHDEQYYGAPVPAASVGSGNRAVPAGQGSRSFARGLARRRPL
jgi:MoxR-like ATPase